MYRRCLLPGVITAMFCLTGCLHSFTTTVVRKGLIGDDAGHDDADRVSIMTAIMPDTYPTHRLSTLGGGAELVSGEKITGNGYGFTSRYEIRDINTSRYRIDEPMSKLMPDGVRSSDADSSVRFIIKDGVLTTHTMPFFDKQLGDDERSSTPNRSRQVWTWCSP